MTKPISQAKIYGSVDTEKIIVDIYGEDFNVAVTSTLIDIDGIAKGIFGWVIQRLDLEPSSRNGLQGTVFQRNLVHWRLEFGVRIWHRISSQQEGSRFEVSTRAGCEAEGAELGEEENSPQFAT